MLFGPKLTASQNRFRNLWEEDVSRYSIPDALFVVGLASFTEEQRRRADELRVAPHLPTQPAVRELSGHPHTALLKRQVLTTAKDDLLQTLQTSPTATVAEGDPSGVAQNDDCRGPLFERTAAVMSRDEAASHRFRTDITDKAEDDLRSDLRSNAPLLSSEHASTSVALPPFLPFTEQRSIPVVSPSKPFASWASSRVSGDTVSQSSLTVPLTQAPEQDLYRASLVTELSQQLRPKSLLPDRSRLAPNVTQLQRKYPRDENAWLRMPTVRSSERSLPQTTSRAVNPPPKTAEVSFATQRRRDAWQFLHVASTFNHLPSPPPSLKRPQHAKPLLPLDITTLADDSSRSARPGFRQHPQEVLGGELPVELGTGPNALVSDILGIALAA